MLDVVFELSYYSSVITFTLITISHLISIQFGFIQYSCMFRLGLYGLDESVHTTTLGLYVQLSASSYDACPSAVTLL